MEGFDIEFKSLKAGEKAIQRAQRELLPVEIEPELEEFFQENGFKQERMSDNIRATVELAMRKSLDDNDLRFITGYMKGDIMVWVFEGFCMLGGRIAITESAETKPFFELLGGLGYKLMEYQGKTSAYLDPRRAISVHDIAEIYDDVAEVDKVHGGLKCALIMPGKATGAILNPLANPIPHDPKDRCDFEPPDELYEPDRETAEFLQGFNDIPQLIHFVEQAKTFFGDSKVLRFYYDRENRIWILRMEEDWGLMCEVFIDVTKPKNRSFRKEIESKFSGIKEWVDQLLYDDSDKQPLNTTVLYSVGKARNLEGLCDLYGKACLWQNKQAELIE